VRGRNSLLNARLLGCFASPHKRRAGIAQPLHQLVLQRILPVGRGPHAAKKAGSTLTFFAGLACVNSTPNCIAGGPFSGEGLARDAGDADAEWHAAEGADCGELDAEHAAGHIIEPLRRRRQFGNALVVFLCRVAQPID